MYLYPRRRYVAAQVAEELNNGHGSDPLPLLWRNAGKNIYIRNPAALLRRPVPVQHDERCNDAADSVGGWGQALRPEETFGQPADRVDQVGRRLDDA